MCPELTPVCGWRCGLWGRDSGALRARAKETDVTAITEYEAGQVEQANASGRTPVVFVHGLWLLPMSWDRWRTVFEDSGYTTLAPGWPDDPNTVDEANAHPDVLAHKTVGQIADHFEDVVGELTRKPAVIGHSFGGLLAQILAGRGVADATVAIDPAPFRGVLPLPVARAQVGVARARQSVESLPRHSSDLRPIPRCECDRRTRSQGALQHLCRTGFRCAALPSRN